MDAHLFRRFCEDLVPALVGVRIEKIHQIATGVTVFTLYGLGKLQDKYNGGADITSGTESGIESDITSSTESGIESVGEHAKNVVLENKIKSLFSDKKQYLIFKEGRSPLLFISDHRPSTGEQPPAFIMRLRKYLAGRRIERVLGKWVERKLYMEIQGGTWLCLDLRQGIELILKRPEEIFPETLLPRNDTQKANIQNYIQDVSMQDASIQDASIQDVSIQGVSIQDASMQDASIQDEIQKINTLLPFSLSYAIEPVLSDPNFEDLWPEWEQVSTWCNTQDITLEEGVKQDFWYNYPVLTPLLRKTIPYLDKEEGAALYADLQYGGGDIVVYVQNENITKESSEAPSVLQQSGLFEVCPWVLPRPLAQKMGFDSAQSKELIFENSILALMHVGTMLLVKLSQLVKNNAVKPLVAEAKRLERLLQKLQKEEERLLQMLAKKKLALLLQANLYSINGDAKEKRIILEEIDGKTHTIELDPSKSIRVNMEHFFHLAGRGKRGLEYLEERRMSVALQREKALQDALQENAMQKGFESKKNTEPKKNRISNKNSGLFDKKIAVNKGSQFKNISSGQEKNSAKNSAKNLVKNKQSKFPSQVQAFRSSEGILILRGRDTKGNGLVLKMSNPYDYWIHVAEGVGAHVIIRRDHPNQEISLKTMHEAGVLALLKSWQKDQDKGLVQYSLAKFIRPMRNAGAGMVHVDKSEGTFLVNIEVELELTLKV